MSKCCMKLLGNVPEGLTPMSIRDEVNKCEAEWTAREVIQHYTSSWQYDNICKPERITEGEVAPGEPNGYSDGSHKNPIGNHWAIGGLGIWWLERCEIVSPLNVKENQYLEHKWKYQGCMQWASFNDF